MRRTHLAEPVRPVLSAMLADVVGDDFIAFFVVTYRQKVDKQETTTMAMIIFGDNKDTAYDGDGNVMMAMMMMTTMMTIMTVMVMRLMTMKTANT